MKIAELENELCFGKKLDESSLSRVLSHAKTKNIGIVSGSRLENEQKVNKHNAVELKNMIRAAGFGYINVIGSYVENAGTPDEKVSIEHSFLVIGGDDKDSADRLLSFLKKAGASFNQESVFFKPFDSDVASLYFVGGHIESIGNFHPIRIGDYYTDMKGKKFTFTDVSLREDLGWLSRWGRSSQIEKYLK